MKKALLVIALATVLALSFSTVAMAKYAGYQYLNGSSDPGYLSWAGANNLATRQGGNNGGTPHGGYAVNTTKCAVCHSAHRARTDATVAGIGSDWKLTPGALSCVACHTPSGSNPVQYSLVEWPATYADGGPHNSFNCLSACHGSVHGGSTSTYGAVTAWNLTNRNDAAIAAAFTAGNATYNTTEAGSNGGTATYAVINSATFTAYTTTSSTDLAVMRAMATGYTCGASGCHSSSQFAVNKKAYAEARAGDPSASTTLNLLRTGHITNIGGGCGPCHGASLPTGWPGAESRCAACHDAVGQATNTTAFPHANRNITYNEKDAAGATTTKFVGNSGTLWMYAGDATFRSGGVPTEQPTGVQDQSRTVILGQVGGDGNVGNINDGTCLKCHGYTYWPTHGISSGSTSSHANSNALNFYDD